MSQSRVFCFRHVERNKSNTDDPQTPTAGGQITAYAMGREIRRRFNPTVMTRTTSPQPRGMRTDVIFCQGLVGWEGTPGRELPEQTIDQRLNDFSTDSRDQIAEGVAAAKTYAKLHGVEAEQGVFMTPQGKVALRIKVGEMIEVIDELGSQAGDHLMTGLHGAGIDGACIELNQRLDEDYPDGMGANGGMFDKVEGFVATFEDGKLVSIEIVRQPDYLKTLATVIE
ncbi:hypothetical protein ACFL0L_01100 [Patescibacteria group bacterium]